MTTIEIEEDLRYCYTPEGGRTHNRPELDGDGETWNAERGCFNREHHGPEHLHVIGRPDGSVEFAVDHIGTLSGAIARDVYGEDAFAVVDVPRDEAVRLAFALLDAANVDLIDLQQRLLRHGQGAYFERGEARRSKANH